MVAVTVGEGCLVPPPGWIAPNAEYARRAAGSQDARWRADQPVIAPALARWFPSSWGQPPAAEWFLAVAGGVRAFWSLACGGPMTAWGWRSGPPAAAGGRASAAGWASRDTAGGPTRTKPTSAGRA